MKSLYIRKLVLAIGLLVSVAAAAQTFKNGVKQGILKVKFKPEMTAVLGKTKVNARSSGFVSGIASVDRTAQLTKASNMYRLFPFDARFEQKLQKHGLHLWYVVEIDNSTDPTLAATQFKQLGEVSTAEVEHEKVLAPFSVIPHVPGAATMEALPFNDPLLKDQWHYSNSGQSGYAGMDVNLFSAWMTTSGASNIIVSVHDQGVDVNHPDLKANIWVNQAELNGVANVDDDANGYVDDVNGYNFERNRGAVDPQYHGTHVAGTVSAVNNNGIGVSGVAGGNGSGNGARIMSLQILGGAAIEKSYVYAANNGAVISQNSWGYTSPYYFDQSVKDAIDYFIEEAGDFDGSPMKGGIVIFAAGNSNSDDEWYPGYYESILSVASLGPEGKRAPYSNFGAWVEVAAPGGDQTLNGKSGVLSTVPQGQYAYIQGTSMACPHVSGIAALALANRTKQLTNTELWNKLVTGVVTIDEINPDFVGKLGSGAIDAELAIRNNQGMAPLSVTDLAVTGIAQEFATIAWTVPTDADDGRPNSFQLYYHTQPLTTGNLVSATKVVIPNAIDAGETRSFEVNGLLGLTTYYFGITSTDRWGNVSGISNIVSEQTNDGPAIAVDENSQSINLEIDVNNSTTGAHEITILNNASGILRWNHLMRHTNTSLAFNSTGLRYPVLAKREGTPQIGRQNALPNTPKIKSNEPVAMAFTPVEKSMSDWPTNIIGETNLSLTNSAGARFFVNEPDGFNLTQVRMYLKHNPNNGPVILEVYKGTTPEKSNLVFAQEHSNWNDSEMWASITLNEQLYFENGSTFWIALHVPAGNLFPLGIGFESDPANSANCFMSFDLGNHWTQLEEAINSKSFAWSMTAASFNPYLGEYLTLEPGSGDINGSEQAVTTLTANAATLINGNYSANLVLSSNDAQNRELRVPVNLTVTGQKPDLKHIDIADFGAVFAGSEKTLELVLDNQGYGNFNEPSMITGTSQFEMAGASPWRIGAGEQEVIRVRFKPSTIGSINDVLTISNGIYTYEIALTGIGAEASKISLTPQIQTKNNITIGDEVQAQVTVTNAGAYPLKYFVPGYDNKGFSNNWPTRYHSYGYEFRTNYTNESNPIAYDFQNIATTGVDITAQLVDDRRYATVDMGFDFPYYGEMMSTIYVAQKGFTAFDNSVQPINTPRLGDSYGPQGYISILGTYLSYLTQGKIFYQREADRLIIQFDNVTDGWSGESVTAQMVLHSNGDIRFYYDYMGLSPTNQSYLSVLMEDLSREDGILVNNYENTIEFYSGLALGFDYPGPNIITAVTNGSGIIMPGNSATVDVTLSTATLAEGLIKRYISFISNDPSNAQASALIELNVTSGGTAMPTLSKDTVAFGDVFQGATRSQLVTIKNPGTATVNITSMAWVGNAFTLTGDRPTIITPSLYKNYSIGIPTTNLGSLEDWLSINYADGTHDTIYVTGRVVVPPAIEVDLSPLQHTLNYGETASVPFNIKNTGQADLDVAVTGKQWLSYEAPAQVTSVTYEYEKHNTGGVYQWLEIRKTGTQMPFFSFEDLSTYWRTLDLPFPIEFYGQTYSSMKIGDNGIISFEEDPQFTFFIDNIPTTAHAGPCIMPYWTFSTFSDYLYPKEDIGVFYQTFDDKLVITWSFFVNNFGGMGDPISAQVIFYKNGSMKFQYKREEGGMDLTSQASSIGVQKDSFNGISISSTMPIDHGQGLAYILVPVKTMAIAPGQTLAGQINLDARNVYGGIYNEDLKIQTNVPGNENLTRLVELTVLGDADVATPTQVDFEERIVAFEWGSPVQNHIPVNIANTGKAPLDINWIQMADGTQSLSLQLYMLVDGWFGPEWQWVDIADVYAWNPPTFKLMPGDKLNARAVFSPAMTGDYTDEVVLTTSIGEERFTLLGKAVEPPVIEVDETPIEVMMNTDAESADRSISFNNLNGKSVLNYEVSIDFGRAGTTSQETMSPKPASTLSLRSEVVTSKLPIARPMETYNRVIRHTAKETADNHVGTGGSAPFTIATQFNAGSEGFNLSHVEAWFRTETVTTGEILVDIRAGGNSLATATTVGQGKLNFTGSGSDEAGGWHTIELNEAALIYPNENFYIAITYPLGLQYPQGTVQNEPSIPGRYYYFSEGQWYDLQNENGFSSVGWLMYGAEKAPSMGTWISITSAPSGTLGVGETGTIQLGFNGIHAERGDQVAQIVFKSNDTATPAVRVPVTLHLNEAPVFANVPDIINLAETETVQIAMPVVDNEGHSFTVNPKQTYPGLNSTFSNGLLSITLSYDYGKAGNYEYAFVATDIHQASREVKVLVEVAHKNRAPQWIYNTKEVEFNASGKLVEFEIADVYSDPDNDVFDFQIISTDDERVEVFASQRGFMIRPQTAGEASLYFTATDSHGAVSRDTLKVIVNVVLGLEPGATRKGLYVYPNPTSGLVQVIVPAAWSGEASFQLMDMAGKQHIQFKADVTASDKVHLDLRGLPAGVYVLHGTAGNARSTTKFIKE